MTIVLPTLNGSRYIQAAIESCLRQTYTAFELIVVDGGSTDGTLAIVGGISDSRLRVVQQPDNRGHLPGALNAGFAQAAGEFFTWAQDDDLFGPQALEVLLRALMAEPAAGLAYTGMWMIDAGGQVIRAAHSLPPQELRWTNVVGHCFLYRRSVAEQVGQYALNFLYAEDNQYWLRVYKQSRLIHVPGRYYYHRLHSASLTMREYGEYRSLRAAARARRQVLGLPRREYYRQLAAADIAEAFAAWEARDLARVRRCVAVGLLRNPAWLRNRGVLSIGSKSLLGMARAR